MKKFAYYNEHDKFAAAWIRVLMKAGHIMEGEVDERSIEDVLPSDVAGFIRCHWFAGIAGWDYALQLANFPADREVWTGSCPCQPFSSAGKQKGVNDERHLWPAWYKLIRDRKPLVIFGEQVASSNVIGRASDSTNHMQTLQNREALRRIQTGRQAEVEYTDQDSRTTKELEIEQSRFSIGVIGSMQSEGEKSSFRSIEGGHSTQDRLGVLRNDPDGEKINDQRRTAKENEREHQEEAGRVWLDAVFDDLESSHYACAASVLPAASVGAPHIRARAWFVAESVDAGRRRAEAGKIETGQRSLSTADQRREFSTGLEGSSSESVGKLVNPINTGLEGFARDGDNGDEPGRIGAHTARPITATSWSDCDWIPCRDGKARPIEPTIFPLAHGIPNRVGILRGAGNAIVPEVAKQFIEAYLEAIA